MLDRLPDAAQVEAELATARAPRRLAFDTTGVTAWDTGLLTFVAKVLDHAASTGVSVDLTGLPEGARRLLALAAAVPERETGHDPAPLPWLARIGTAVVAASDGAVEMLRFIGGAVLALAAFARGRARFQRGDFALIVQDCGPRALPIVTLISFLVGLILAFVGAVQLRQFGAQIYVADLVGIAMATEMGAMMTAIIMAGRTGAAFAAQLGTMQVNEEIDALTTMGISPMEFLVLPRMLALVLMVPLLTLYADLLGILGGTLVACDHARPDAHAVHQRDHAALTVADFRQGAHQEHGVRCPRRHRRVPARDAVRAQLGGGGPGRHLRRGHRHRVHHRLRRDPDHHLQCPRRLARRPASPRRPRLASR